MINYTKITDYIIKTVQKESILSGFQYAISFSCIENIFNIEVNKEIAKQIELELEVREEVADVICDDDMFDVVLYTIYAPNYINEDE